MYDTDDDFISGMVCGMLLADTTPPKWSWTDFLVYFAAGIITVILVGVPVWLFCLQLLWGYGILHRCFPLGFQVPYLRYG